EAQIPHENLVRNGASLQLTEPDCGAPTHRDSSRIQYACLAKSIGCETGRRSSVNLFAYGTLMTADGFFAVLGERGRGFRYRVATLRGWRGIWNTYREKWHGGVLNAERGPSGVIVGVLVQKVTPEDLDQLDSQEDTHLPRQTVIVELENGESVSAE